MTEIMNLSPHILSDQEKDLQEKANNLYIVSTLLGVDPRQTKSYSEFKKALDSTTGSEGDEWVPTALAADYIQAFRLESKVASLFQDITMPSNPYDMPYLSSGATFYYVGESTSDSPTASPPSTAATGKQTFTAKKLKARMLFSDEFDEDSIIPVIPALRQEIITNGAETLDDCILNGDTTATHMDSNVTDSKDRRKIWNGLRDLCPAGTKKDLGTFSYANHRTIVVAMGKYGMRGDDMAIISGPVGINQYRSLTNVVTVDKYGPKAFVLTGELAKMDGIPLIASEKIGENLNASAVYDGSTTDNTIAVYVNRKGFMLGTRGGVKLDFVSDPTVDQNQLIMSFRKDFQNRWTVSSSVTTIGLAYNIAV